MIGSNQIFSDLVEQEILNYLISGSLPTWPTHPDKTLVNAFKKLPIADDLSTKEDKKIDVSLVHKKFSENVLLSEPRKIGCAWYFNMYESTKEFNFDHPSDHVQGMLLIESARQAAIATSHLEGLPKEGIITLNVLNIEFFHFVYSNSPIIVRAISRPVITKNGKFLQYVIINIIQFDKVCASAILQGMSFDSTDSMSKHMAVMNRFKK